MASINGIHWRQYVERDNMMNINNLFTHSTNLTLSLHPQIPFLSAKDVIHLREIRIDWDKSKFVDGARL